MQDGHTHTPRTPTLFSFTSVSMQKMMTLFVQGVPGPDRKLRQTLEPPLSPSPLPPPPSPSIGSRYRGRGQGSTSHIQAQSLPPQSSHPFYSGHPPPTLRLRGASQQPCEVGSTPSPGAHAVALGREQNLAQERPGLPTAQTVPLRPLEDAGPTRGRGGLTSGRGHAGTPRS